MKLYTQVLASALALGTPISGDISKSNVGLMDILKRPERKSSFRGFRTKKRKRVGNPSRKHRHNSAKGLARVIDLSKVNK